MSYALLATYTLTGPLPPLEDTCRRLVGESQHFVDQSGATTRGWYDVSGFSAGADLLVWWTDDDPERLQDAAHRLRASALGRYLAPEWSVISRGDLPTTPAGDWLAVLPDTPAPKRVTDVTVTELTGRGLGAPQVTSLVEGPVLDDVIVAASKPAQSGLARAVVGAGYTGVRVSPAEWAERQPRA
ncbi:MULTISPECIES: chlorite dismutase family protein [Actinomyces]|uniref:hydrogen peroxide-dependent heme synthase n=1 Tax=Actinomyces respiraculi TaxID=2744574 RepID=A0A7T0LKL0_9ACTO|nr:MULTISPECIES: chlorite dismutase family protein [Actinomyces]QPL05337.1 chlorite dismutase family protein [Actinomyces respiraculi]